MSRGKHVIELIDFVSRRTLHVSKMIFNVLLLKDVTKYVTEECRDENIKKAGTFIVLYVFSIIYYRHYSLNVGTHICSEGQSSLFHSRLKHKMNTNRDCCEKYNSIDNQQEKKQNLIKVVKDMAKST